jgi:hypothetical protein
MAGRPARLPARPRPLALALTLAVAALLAGCAQSAHVRAARTNPVAEYQALQVCTCARARAWPCVARIKRQAVATLV